HFVETYVTTARLQRRYDLNLVRLEPGPDPAVYDRHGCEACCASRKVAPMARYLEGKAAWVTGLRRSDSPTRVGARAVEWDARPGGIAPRSSGPHVEQRTAGQVGRGGLGDVVVSVTPVVPGDALGPGGERGVGLVGAAGTGPAVRFAPDFAGVIDWADERRTA